MDASQQPEKLVSKCRKAGCPRKRRISRTYYDPKDAVEMELKYPWHDDGDFDAPVYFDNDGEVVSQEPEV